jgi:phospholipase/lecithinase/hemolysin
MGQRNPGKRYHLSAPESLEGRVVLSTSQVANLMGGPAVHLARLEGPSRPVTIGAVGDSLTDEYISYRPDRSQARNWVELLSSTNLANFGKFSRASRGEPRNEGFAFNWARGDATSSDLVANQLAGLAGQVRRGQVRYASVIIGDNDFRQFLQEAPPRILDQSFLITQLAQVEARAEANFDTTVQTLLTANPRVRLVVGTIPDLTQSPAIRQQAAPFGPLGQALLNLTSQAIAQYNAHVREVADGSPRIALADLAAQTSRLESSPGMVPFGGQTIDLTTPGNNYHHFFLADNYHPGTVGQGLIANTIVDAINTEFQAGIRPLSPRQIIHRAQNVHRFP